VGFYRLLGDEQLRGDFAIRQTMRNGQQHLSFTLRQYLRAIGGSHFAHQTGCDFWRSLKYEDIHLRDYATVPDLEAGLQRYFAFYNDERPHQSLNYAVPSEVHQSMVTLVC